MHYLTTSALIWNPEGMHHFSYDYLLGSVSNDAFHFTNHSLVRRQIITILLLLLLLLQHVLLLLHQELSLRMARRQELEHILIKSLLRDLIELAVCNAIAVAWRLLLMHHVIIKIVWWWRIRSTISELVRLSIKPRSNWRLLLLLHLHHLVRDRLLLLNLPSIIIVVLHVRS